MRLPVLTESPPVLTRAASEVLFSAKGLTKVSASGTLHYRSEELLPFHPVHDPVQQGATTSLLLLAVGSWVKAVRGI